MAYKLYLNSVVPYQEVLENQEVEKRLNVKNNIQNSFIYCDDQISSQSRVNILKLKDGNDDVDYFISEITEKLQIYEVIDNEVGLIFGNGDAQKMQESFNDWDQACFKEEVDRYESMYDIDKHNFFYNLVKQILNPKTLFYNPDKVKEKMIQQLY